ncbi:E3 ubiquitin-protein ligase UBR7, partial [Phenoliferia sp. Uapishka_3]
MLSRDSLLFSPTRDGVPSSDDNFTAHDIMQAQSALEEEAREAIPYSHTTCTYDQGPIKQPGASNSIAFLSHPYGESNKYHGRRQFSLVKPASTTPASVPLAQSPVTPNTTWLSSLCEEISAVIAAPQKWAPVPAVPSPHVRTPHQMSTTNTTRLFEESFVSVGRIMIRIRRRIQCISVSVVKVRSRAILFVSATRRVGKLRPDSDFGLADWLHHACLFGTHADANTSPLDTDDFDMLVCAACVTTDPRVRKIMEVWAGVEGSGVMMVSKDDVVVGRTLGDEEDEEGTENGEDVVGERGEKRKADGEDAEEPVAKKVKTGRVHPKSSSSSFESGGISSDPPSASASTEASTVDSACMAPPTPEGGSILSKMEREGGRMNVYLEEGWMERWCRCDKCLNLFISFPFFLEEEEIFEPPDDPDARLEALDRMPRGESVGLAMAYKHLEDRLKARLGDVASSGRSVSKEDIQSFFAQMQEERRAISGGR